MGIKCDYNHLVVRSGVQLLLGAAFIVNLSLRNNISFIVSKTIFKMLAISLTNS